MKAEEAVLELLDTSIESFDGLADILERKPTLVGILEAHDKCLDLRKTYMRARRKIGAGHE